MSDPTRAFYERQTKTPVPGQIGPSADLYLQTLKMNGLAVLTLYDYHRELVRLGELFPGKEPEEFDTFTSQISGSALCAAPEAAAQNFRLRDGGERVELARLIRVAPGSQRGCGWLRHG